MHLIEQIREHFFYPILREIRELKIMSSQVSADLQTINTAVTDLSTQISSIATELQNLKSGTVAGNTISDSDVALIHDLATRASAADEAAKALVPAAPVVTDPAQTEQPSTDQPAV